MQKNNDFVSGMLNDASLGDKPNPAQDGASVIDPVPLHVDQLVPTTGNFYGVRDIDSMKESILTVGVLQNLIVKARNDGKYDIYAGERRWTASKQLVEEGHPECGWLPCAISPPDEDPIITEYKLITTNKEVRNKSNLEIVEEAVRAEENARKRKKLQSLPGRVREIAAQSLGIKPTQMGQYHAIANKLHPELKTALHNNELGINAAYELTALPVEQQLAVFNMYRDIPGGLTVQAAREAKTTPKQAVGVPEPQAYHSCLMGDGRCTNAEILKSYMATGAACVGCCSICTAAATCEYKCEKAKAEQPVTMTTGESETVLPPLAKGSVLLPPGEAVFAPPPVENVEYITPELPGVPGAETTKREVKKLKLLMPYFQDVQSGLMTFNIRKNDRDYTVGDSLELVEYTGMDLTGRACFAEVVYMLDDFPGIEPGYCILGLRVV